jgi:hypothetical protein
MVSNVISKPRVTSKAVSMSLKIKSSGEGKNQCIERKYISSTNYAKQISTALIVTNCERIVSLLIVFELVKDRVYKAY